MPVTWPVTGIWLAAGLPASAPACACSKVMMNLQSKARGCLLTAELELMTCCLLPPDPSPCQTCLKQTGKHLWARANPNNNKKIILFLIWIGPGSPSSFRSVCHHTIWRWGEEEWERFLPSRCPLVPAQTHHEITGLVV